MDQKVSSHVGASSIIIDHDDRLEVNANLSGLIHSLAPQGFLSPSMGTHSLVCMHMVQVVHYLPGLIWIDQWCHNNVSDQIIDPS